MHPCGYKYLNKWATLGYRIFLRRIPINKYKCKEGLGKSPLGQHHSNICCRQDPLMDANISGQKSKGKEDITLHSK